jgi:tRNA (cmo5U34)-methyltransferase
MTNRDSAAVAPTWSEKDSEKFIDYGRYFVPEREEQLRIVCDLIPPAAGPHHVVDLCAGEGLLSQALLECDSRRTVHVFDGSRAMLDRAATVLGRYRDRVDFKFFDIFSRDWRRFEWPVHAVVSSLAVHHLDGAQKQELFRDMASALAPGGALVIADVVLPATELTRNVAARLWDQAVQKRALSLDGNLKAFEHFRDTNWNMYTDPAPDPVDKPSTVAEQLAWMQAAGLVGVDLVWMAGGHAIFCGYKAESR